jgi:heterodisulfide reductase subunit D
MFDADLASAIAARKMEEVLSTGAQVVVTSCQQCVRTMTTYAKRKGAPIEVMDLVQLVNKALAEPDA